MEFNALTTTLTNFISIFSLGYSNLWASTLWLWTTLLAIEIILFGIYFAFGAKNFADAFWKVIFIGFWWWIVNAFPTIANLFMNSFVAWGNTAGGGGPTYLLDPSSVAGLGLDAGEPLLDAIDRADTFDVGTKILLALLWLIVILVFFLIAIQIFITVLEFYLVVAISSILLPFGLLKRTKFLAEKVMGGLISFGVKLMVLSFLMTAAGPVLVGASLPANPGYNEILGLVLTVGALAILVWNAPGIAAGMLAGSPSLTAGTVAQGAAMGVAGGAVVTSGGFAATRAAASLAGAGARGAAGLAGGVRAGAALGSAVQTGGTAARIAGGAYGGAVGGANALIRSTTSSVSNVASRSTARLRNSYLNGGRAAVGLPARPTTTAAPAPAPTARPAWADNAARRAATLGHMTNEARPGGSGPNVRL